MNDWTIIVAATPHTALVYAEEHDLQHWRYANDATSLRGYTSDRIALVPGWGNRQDANEIEEYLAVMNIAEKSVEAERVTVSTDVTVGGVPTESMTDRVQEIPDPFVAHRVVTKLDYRDLLRMLLTNKRTVDVKMLIDGNRAALRRWFP